MNLPNKLTVLRILLIPVFVLFFYLTIVPYHYLISAIIFIVACCTDFLDGYIARKYNLVTNLGKFLDPIADKVLVSTALIIMLTVPELFTIAFPYAWTMLAVGICVAVILARELIVSGFRMVAASAGIVLAADMVGKWKTTFQDVAIAVLLISASFTSTFGLVLTYVGAACLVIATLLTIVSGCNYLIKNKAVLKS
ncbi:MAG: CDP-diacylglycerol--glycerol-3-phosphate 3-phosphatidyltransferase [Clostridia bacterium]|nr:CDP-diacylglycerol--glycerol-3-phosphate 3-phosphatidyltransferase [Clostridia bacterium]